MRGRDTISTWPGCGSSSASPSRWPRCSPRRSCSSCSPRGRSRRRWPPAIGLPLWAQLIVFGGVTAATLGLVRPAITARLSRAEEAAQMGLAEIEGGIGLVLETVDLDHGLIKIEGETWSARSYDATQVIEKGERVRVIEIKGATALVWRE